MENSNLLDWYNAYRISAFGQTTATGLSSLPHDEISPDQIQRSLASEAPIAADLWCIAKPPVHKIESAAGVMIVEDRTAEKPYTDENDIICWHYDHSKPRNIKGINLVTALYHQGGVSWPVGFERVHQTERYPDPNSGTDQRRSSRSQNEMDRDLRQPAVKNQIPFKSALNDFWFASADNMNGIKHTLQKDLVMPLKANRKVATSANAKPEGRE